MPKLIESSEFNPNLKHYLSNLFNDTVMDNSLNSIMNLGLCKNLTYERVSENLIQLILNEFKVKHAVVFLRHLDTTNLIESIKDRFFNKTINYPFPSRLCRLEPKELMEDYLYKFESCARTMILSDTLDDMLILAESKTSYFLIWYDRSGDNYLVNIPIKNIGNLSQLNQENVLISAMNTYALSYLNDQNNIQTTESNTQLCFSVKIADKVSIY